MSSRIFVSRAVLTAALLSAGCVDPEAKYDDFADRVGTKTGSVGSCDGGGTPPQPGEGNGPVLLTVAAIVPTQPIIFRGTVESLDVGGKTGLKFDLVPLNAFDRTTPVGEPQSYDPFVIGDDGVLVAEIPRGTTPADANPLTPGDVDAQVTLRGTVCQVAEPWSAGGELRSCETESPCNFYCGILEGQVYAPITQELTGAFTLTRLADINAQPEPPPIDCEGNLAGPPPPPR
jgi:hypothetical protein